MEISFKAAVDSGNSEQAMMINGEKILQPSTIAKETSNPFYEDKTLDHAVKTIFKQLVISINSTSVEPGMYFVGENAIQQGDSYKNMMLGFEDKHQSDVPVIMTLGMLAAKAVQAAYEKDTNLEEPIKLKVDMITGLPCTEYDQEIGLAFADRYTKDKHDVRVYLGKNKTVKVEIEFDFVKVVPEASPVVFSLWQDENGEVREGIIFEEFINAYKTDDEDNEWNDMDGNIFVEEDNEKKLLHIDIGDGTTEYPITVGLEPDQKFKKGSNNGIGHAVENSVDELAAEINVPSMQRHTVSKILKDSTHKYHHTALRVVDNALSKQADEILRQAGKQMNSVQNELDVVVVYGGGSVLLKKHLYPRLKKVCDTKQIKLLYIPEQFAATLYVEGLNNILNSELFEQFKKQALAAK
ncbi:hypothetical protein [Bacillus sp. Brlt_9]|uniref:ParM/StbA family protein n=1 Tax=Bacillus sp. Brlt_9 TaxID=3110916 RepID=UPI003F7B7A34